MLDISVFDCFNIFPMRKTGKQFETHNIQDVPWRFMKCNNYYSVQYSNYFLNNYYNFTLKFKYF